MGSSPHLCTVALSLVRSHNEIGHDHEGAVPLEVRSRGGKGRALRWENIPKSTTLPQQAPRIYKIPSSLRTP